MLKIQGESNTNYKSLEEGKSSPFDQQKVIAVRLKSVVQENLTNVQGVVTEAKRGPKGCCSTCCPSPWLILPGVLSGLCTAGTFDSYYVTQDEFGKIAYPFGTFMSLCLYGVLWFCVRKARTGDLLLANVDKFEDLVGSMVKLHAASSDALEQAIQLKESIVPEMEKRIALIEQQHAENRATWKAQIQELEEIQVKYNQLSQSISVIPGNNDKLGASIKQLSDLVSQQSSQPHINPDELRLIVDDTNDHTAANDQQRGSVSTDLVANLENQALLVAALNEGVGVIAGMLSGLQTENAHLTTLQAQIAAKEDALTQRLDEEAKLQDDLRLLMTRVELLTGQLGSEEALKEKFAATQVALLGSLMAAQIKVSTLQSANKALEQQLIQVKAELEQKAQSLQKQ